MINDDPTGAAQRKGAVGHDDSGHIEAMEITRLITPRSGGGTGTTGLSFAGRPLSKRGRAQRVHVAFVEEGTGLPKPAFDPASGSIDLYYFKSKYQEVHAMLTSKRARLCYFWSSADGASRRAWLLTAGA